MAKTKNKRSGKPRGMNYADMLARKRMIREAVQEAADDATVQLRADMATQKALWLAVCSVAARRWSPRARKPAAWRSEL